MILPGNQSPSRRRRERGSVLVFCMVLAALGTIGLAAWLSLLSARSHQVEANFTALKRRAVQNNSKALAYHALYRNHLHIATGLNAAKTYTLPDSLGRVTIRSYAAAPLAQASTRRMSKIGTTPLRSYTTDVIADIGLGTTTIPWTFQLRSENPMMGGELLAFHPPADFDSAGPIVSGNLRVKGRAVFWDAGHRDFTAGVQADEFLLPNDLIQTTTFRNTAGANILPLNYPIPRQTTGFAGSNPSYLGELDIVSSTANSHNSHVHRIRATGSYFEFSGSTAAARGRGGDTRPPGANDSTNISIIATSASSSPPDPNIRSKLATASPLSSDVLNFAIDHPAAFPANDLFEVLNLNTPLPNDVISRLGRSTVTVPSEADKKTLFKNSSAWAVSNGAGKVTVGLDEADLQHLIITDVSELVLNGPSTTTQVNALATQPARAIAIVNTNGTSLNDVRLVNQSRRRLSLALTALNVAGGGTYIPNFTFSGVFPFPAWAMVMDLQNAGGRFDVGPVSSARIIGGIRANRSLSVVGGDLLLERETVIDSYNNLLSRNAWIEAYRN
jgi:hypothetical protein